MKLPTVQLSPVSRYFIPLRSKYFPQLHGTSVKFFQELQIDDREVAERRVMWVNM
jgi:hypothetical protein